MTRSEIKPEPKRRSVDEIRSNLYEVLEPSERFSTHALIIAKARGIQQQTPEGCTTWNAEVPMPRESMMYIIDIDDYGEGDRSTSLEVYLTSENDGSELVTTYWSNPETHGKIFKRDELTGEVISEKRLSQDHEGSFVEKDNPEKEALRILAHISPKSSENLLRHATNERFWILVGDYLISNRKIEDKIDKANDAKTTQGRKTLTKYAVRAAFDTFRLDMLRSVMDMRVDRRKVKLKHHVQTTDYARKWYHFGMDAAEIAAEGGGRLRDLTWHPEVDDHSGSSIAARLRKAGRSTLGSLRRMSGF